MTKTAADLIAEYNTLSTYLDAESKRFNEHMKPVNERVQAIKNELLDLLNARKEESVKTEHGTAYTSTIVTPRIKDGEKETYLDWVLENWNERGAMLQIGAPQKDAVKTYMDDHDGALPPHIETSSIIRVNIRKS